MDEYNAQNKVDTAKEFNNNSEEKFVIELENNS